MVAVVEQTTRERAQEAVTLRDQGRHNEAAKLFQQNVEEIQTVQGTFARPSKALDGLQRQYDAFSKTAPAAPASQLMMERKVLRQMDFGQQHRWRTVLICLGTRVPYAHVAVHSTAGASCKRIARRVARASRW